MKTIHLASIIMALFGIGNWFALPGGKAQTTVQDLNHSISTADLEWIRNQTQACADEHHIPSMVIGLVKDGKIAAYIRSGNMSRRSKQPVDENTLFQIASLSKSFTGIIANHLVLEGKLDPNQSIVSYLPDHLSEPTKVKLQPITVNDILHHQAGLPWDAKYAKRVILGGPMYGDYNEADLLKDIEELVINQDQVGKFSYSNLGYAIIGYIMERITGSSYESMLQKFVVTPYNLPSTTTEPNFDHVATPYRPEWRKIKTKPWKMGKLRAGGGVFSSVSDLSSLMVKQLELYRRTRKSEPSTP